MVQVFTADRLRLTLGFLKPYRSLKLPAAINYLEQSLETYMVIYDLACHKAEGFIMTKLTKVFIGVDVAKNSLDINIYPLKKCFKINNTEHDIKQFIQELAKYNIQQIACEATGGYEKTLKNVLTNHSYSLWIVDPKRVKAFILASGCKSKTDKIDAQKIAEFAYKNNKEYKSFSKDKDQEKMQALVNRRGDLVEFAAMEKTRLQHPSHESAISSIEKLIKILEKEIRKIDQQISDLIESNESLSQKAKILKSIPGFGPVAISTLLSFVIELGELSNSKISALLGVCPYDNESGKYKGRKFIRGGRAAPRKVLYMCALSAIRLNPVLKSFYERLISAGKCFKVAIVAVMHKLIIIANSILKKGELCKV